MIRELTCIACPMGCTLRVELAEDRVVQVEGHRCCRGEAFAREEITAPKRILATSVKVLNGTYPLVSVRTDRPIPKELIPKIMKLVREIAIPAPVELGQGIIPNLLGTGANLVATRRVPRRNECPSPREERFPDTGK